MDKQLFQNLPMGQPEFPEYQPVLSEIEKRLGKGKTVVVAIDGRCGSGKTELAEWIGERISCNVIHMDDFYLPFSKRPENWLDIPGGNMDFARFQAEILNPIQSGGQIYYRPYRCREDVMEDGVLLERSTLTVIEGSYSHQPALSAAYDLKIFLTCPKEEQEKRLRAREGSRFSAFQSKWIPLEERYFRQYHIEADSHLVVDTGRNHF